MIKYKSLLIVFLALAFVVSFSIVFAKSEKAGANNGTSSELSNATTTPKNQGQVTAAEHRSVVANFVQSIVHVADREKGGIGEQVRLIAMQQNQSEATTTEAIDEIENRSKIITFLIGSDYKNLGALRSEMVQTRNRIGQLTNLMGKAKNASSTEEIQTQIQTLQQEQTKIENFIKAQEGKFSLFGWLVKLFQ